MSKSQPQRLAPGTRVTCHYRGAHQGTVLADTDPRCWAGSIAFADETPDAAAVEKHVAMCKERGWGGWEQQPVLWDFGKIYWDSKLKAIGMEASVTDERVAHG